MTAAFQACYKLSQWRNYSKSYKSFKSSQINKASPDFSTPLISCWRLNHSWAGPQTDCISRFYYDWSMKLIILTSEAGRGHPPGKHSHPGFRWNTSHRSGTCQQEAHILVNYTFAISTANHREGTEKQPPIRAGQGRPGGGHTGGGRGQGRSSPGGSSQSWCRFFVLGGCFDFARKFWSRWLVTPKQANADITSVKKQEGEKGEKGEGDEEGEGRSKIIILKKAWNKLLQVRRGRWRGGREGEEGQRGGKDGQDVNNNQQRTESQGKAKISVKRPVVNNNNNITATWETTRSCGGGGGVRIRVSAHEKGGWEKKNKATETHHPCSSFIKWKPFF